MALISWEVGMEQRDSLSSTVMVAEIKLSRWDGMVTSSSMKSSLNFPRKLSLILLDSGSHAQSSTLIASMLL